MKTASLIICLFLILIGCENRKEIDRSTTRHTTDDGAQQQALDNSGEQRHDGLTLKEWREKIKNLDPQDPASHSLIGGLINLVSNSSVPAMTRRQAAFALAQIGKPASERTIPLLIGLMQDQPDINNDSFFWVVKALARFGRDAKDAAPHLCSVVLDAAQPMARRQASVEPLAQIGTAHRKVVPTLISLLENRRRKVPLKNLRKQSHDITLLRVYAADALGLIGATASSAIPALIRATRDKNETVRHSAVGALAAMGPRAEIALPAIHDALIFDTSPSVRDKAAEALAKIGTEAIPTLVRLLRDNDEQVRHRAARALGDLGKKAVEAAGPLKAALDDSSAIVRLNSAEALWKITAKSQHVVEALLRELTDSHRSIRMHAYRVLVGMGPEARVAIEPLKKLGSDHRAYVRQLVAKALKTIEAAE